jgi:hypothetical protein
MIRLIPNAVTRPHFSPLFLTSLHSPRRVAKKTVHRASDHLSKRCHKPMLTAALDQSTRANTSFTKTDNNTNAGHAYKFHRLEVCYLYTSSVPATATNNM